MFVEESIEKCGSGSNNSPGANRRTFASMSAGAFKVFFFFYLDEQFLHEDLWVGDLDLLSRSSSLI